jgi:hypothetical protein
MPEATVNKDRDPRHGEGEVGFTAKVRYRSDVLPKPKTASVQGAADE